MKHFYWYYCSTALQSIFRFRKSWNIRSKNTKCSKKRSSKGWSSTRTQAVSSLFNYITVVPTGKKKPTTNNRHSDEKSRRYVIQSNSSVFIQTKQGAAHSSGSEKEEDDWEQRDWGSHHRSDLSESTPQFTRQRRTHDFLCYTITMEMNKQ